MYTLSWILKTLNFNISGYGIAQGLEIWLMLI